MIYIFAGEASSSRLRRTDGVIALPAHFKVDDPEPTGYDANFGRRIIQEDFADDDQIVQASTLEEVNKQLTNFSPQKNVNKPLSFF